MASPLGRCYPHPPATGFFSACLLAVLACLLPVSASAQPIDAPSQQPTAELQGMVDDLGWQLAQSFRGSGPEFNKRYEQLRLALEAWRASPRSSDDYALMQAWLEKAIRVSLPGTRRSLPAPPKFGVHRAIATRPSTEPAATETLPAPAPEHTAQTPPGNQPPAIEQQPAPRQPSTGQPNTGQLSTGQLSTEQPSTGPEVAQSNIEQPSPRVEIAATPPRAEPQAETRVPPPAPAPVETTQPSLRRHPAAATLSWSDPFVDDPLPNNQNSATRVATRQPTTGRTTRLKPVGNSVAGEVKMNLSELSARVRGYRQGLDFVEAELIGSGDATAFKLAGLVRELQSLADQRDLLELYYAGLSELERAAMPDLPSPRAAYRLVASRADDRQATIENATSSSADAERAVLTGVGRKLRQLVEKASGQ